MKTLQVILLFLVFFIILTYIWLFFGFVAGILFIGDFYLGTQLIVNKQ